MKVSRTLRVLNNLLHFLEYSVCLFIIEALLFSFIQANIKASLKTDIEGFILMNIAAILLAIPHLSGFHKYKLNKTVQ